MAQLTREVGIEMTGGSPSIDNPALAGLHPVPGAFLVLNGRETVTAYALCPFPRREKLFKVM